MKCKDANRKGECDYDVLVYSEMLIESMNVYDLFSVRSQSAVCSRAVQTRCQGKLIMKENPLTVDIG